MPPFIDMTGLKYGRLTAVERVNNSRYGQTMWLFKCECGKEIVTTGFAVRSGHTTSCGCYLSEKTASLKYSHGMARTRIYRTYQHMKEDVLLKQIKDTVIMEAEELLFVRNG